MEFFRNPNIDFLGKKWYFLAFSLVFSVAGLLSMAFWHGIPLGLHFRGGTLVEGRFPRPPNDSAIRSALDRAGLHQAKIQTFGAPGNNEVLINLSLEETSEQALDRGKNLIINALQSNAPQGKQDLNNAGALTIQNYLMEKDPLHAGTDANQRYSAIAQAIVHHR